MCLTVWKKIVYLDGVVLVTIDRPVVEHFALITIGALATLWQVVVGVGAVFLDVVRLPRTVLGVVNVEAVADITEETRRSNVMAVDGVPSVEGVIQSQFVWRVELFQPDLFEDLDSS